MKRIGRYIPGLALFLLASAAQAQTVIGDAARIVNDVTGTLGGRRSAIVSGAAVHQNEIVSTGRSASADLRFLDNTSLSVSPGSSVKLDRYVYHADGSARGAVVSMTRGAFRFTTGQSDPSAFRLQTPQAIIGIRGTVLEIDIERGVTHVTLLQGAIDVCARGNPRSCGTLTRPGSSISVTRTRVLDDGADGQEQFAPPVLPPGGPGGIIPGLLPPGGGIWIGPGRFPGPSGGRPGGNWPGGGKGFRP